MNIRSFACTFQSQSTVSIQAALPTCLVLQVDVDASMSNNIVTNALLVTLATERPFGAEMPRCVLGALCAVNMLLMIDDGLLDTRTYRFADFSITPLADGAGTRITFTDASSHRAVDVDRNALQHLKTSGSWRDLRLYNQRAKL